MLCYNFVFTENEAVMLQFYTNESEKQNQLRKYLREKTFDRSVQGELISLTEEQRELIVRQLRLENSPPNTRQVKSTKPASSLKMLQLYMKNYQTQQLKLKSLTNEWESKLPDLILDKENLIEIYPQVTERMSAQRLKELFEIVKSEVCSSLLKAGSLVINDELLSKILKGTHEELAKSMKTTQTRVQVPRMILPKPEPSTEKTTKIRARDTFFTEEPVAKKIKSEDDSNNASVSTTSLDDAFTITDNELNSLLEFFNAPITDLDDSDLPTYSFI